MLLITLKIPEHKLSPNSRTHWAKKASPTKRHREAAKVATLGLLDLNQPRPVFRTYSYAYYWKQASHRRDDDNAISSAKPYLDGIADALRVNDRDLSFGSLTHHVDPEHPRLEITLHP